MNDFLSNRRIWHLQQLAFAWAAVRRLAYEAADTGLLSPELTAGIRRVKGAKRWGVRIGNWLSVEQSRTPTAQPEANILHGKRASRLRRIPDGHLLRRVPCPETWRKLR
jgi:hypothetical protein